MSYSGLPLDYLSTVHAVLERRYGKAALAPGLTMNEFHHLEEEFGLCFPPDLRSFLHFTLPVHPDFPNWRDDAAQELQRDQEYVLRGIWNDVDPRREPYWDLNTDGDWELVTPAFQPRRWLPSWGPVPEEKERAYAIVSEQLARAPRLLRIYGHRYLPDAPAAPGNPVYSIVQTDIIHYGYDLVDYFAKEFNVPRPAWAALAPREIPFWSDLVRLNDAWP